jgi:4-hydroxybenzoate polyprenyltransferase
VNVANKQLTLSGLSQWKVFLALSRTPHGLLDVATPALAALLWHGSFPQPEITILGLVTAFAGYTAVYALNDLVDYRADKKRVAVGLSPNRQNDVDSIFVRHPLAYGLLPFGEGIFWVLAWASIALIGSYFLNPFCAAIFLTSCLLEAIYCILWKSSYLKLLISGAVKTAGPMAAVFAVDPDPAPLLLALLFFWLFFWEIGGQNIPNDWADIEEDRLLQATTVPVRFGPAIANVVILLSLLLAVALNVVLLWLSPVGIQPISIWASLTSGMYLLLIPAYRLLRTGDRLQALALFNSASYYPVTMLGVIILSIAL